MYKFIAINTVMSDYFTLEIFKTFKEITIVKFNTSCYLLILAKIWESVSKNNFKKYLDFIPGSSYIKHTFAHIYELIIIAKHRMLPNSATSSVPPVYGSYTGKKHESW